MNNVGTAYVLWLGCLLQLHGLHRLYNGKILTGLIWLFSFGLFGVGQIIDLLLIPNMVDEHNDKLAARQGALPGKADQMPAIEQVVENSPPSNDFTYLPTPPPVLLLAPPKLENPTPAPPAVPLLPAPNLTPLIVKILKSAETRGGAITVTHGVMDTGASFAEVEAALMQIVRAGYADIANHPETGVVMYEFREL